MSMSDLVTWLRAQLDDDERVAQAVPFSHWSVSRPPGFRITLAGRSGVNTWSHLAESVDYHDAKGTAVDHAAHWDPARVLAEVDAKRRMISDYEMVVAQQQANSAKFVALTDGRPGNEAEYVSVKTQGWKIEGRLEGLRTAIRWSALPLADRDGYREEWRP